MGAINGIIQLPQHCLFLDFGMEKGEKLNVAILTLVYTSDKHQMRGDHVGPRVSQISSRKETCLPRSPLLTWYKVIVEKVVCSCRERDGLWRT